MKTAREEERSVRPRQLVGDAGQVEGGQFFVGDVSKFPFAALILDLQNLIAAEFLDGATRCSLALSCQSFYRRFYDKELYGLGFPLECIRAGHDDLLAFALDELGCPLLPSPYLSRFSLDAELKFHNQTFAILERISMDSFFGKKDETETLDFYEVFASLVARSTDADYNRIIEGKLWKRFSDMPFLSKKSLLLKLAGKGCLRFLKLVSKFADAGEDLSRVPTVPTESVMPFGARGIVQRIGLVAGEQIEINLGGDPRDRERVVSWAHVATDDVTVVRQFIGWSAPDAIPDEIESSLFAAVFLNMHEIRGEGKLMQWAVDSLPFYKNIIPGLLPLESLLPTFVAFHSQCPPDSIRLFLENCVGFHVNSISLVLSFEKLISHAISAYDFDLFAFILDFYLRDTLNWAITTSESLTIFDFKTIPNVNTEVSEHQIDALIKMIRYAADLIPLDDKPEVQTRFRLFHRHFEIQGGGFDDIRKFVQFGSPRVFETLISIGVKLAPSLLESFIASQFRSSLGFPNRCIPAIEFLMASGLTVDLQAVLERIRASSILGSLIGERYREVFLFVLPDRADAVKYITFLRQILGDAFLTSANAGFFESFLLRLPKNAGYYKPNAKKSRFSEGIEALRYLFVDVGIPFLPQYLENIVNLPEGPWREALLILAAEIAVSKGPSL